MQINQRLLQPAVQQHQTLLAVGVTLHSKLCTTRGAAVYKMNMNNTHPTGHVRIATLLNPKHLLKTHLASLSSTVRQMIFMPIQSCQDDLRA
jgi:hypothetical protein